MSTRAGLRRSGTGDRIAHSPSHAASRLAARSLARRCGVPAEPLSLSAPPDAALLIAPAREARHRDAGPPVLVLTRRSTWPPLLAGQPVVCGVRDASDAPAAAIAGAVAQVLDAPLVLAHATAPVAVGLPGPAPVSLWGGVAPEQRVAANGVLEHVAHAAGLPDAYATLVRSGPPAPALLDVARSLDAAVLVISRSQTPRWLAAVTGSPAGRLLRRSPCPVLVCPRDPVAAMRVRAALLEA